MGGRGGPACGLAGQTDTSPGSFLYSFRAESGHKAILRGVGRADAKRRWARGPLLCPAPLCATRLSAPLRRPAGSGLSHPVLVLATGGRQRTRRVTRPSGNGPLRAA